MHEDLATERDLWKGCRGPVEKVVVATSQVQVEERREVGALRLDRAVRVDRPDQWLEGLRGQAESAGDWRPADLQVSEAPVRAGAQCQVALPAALVGPELLPARVAGGECLAAE